MIECQNDVGGKNTLCLGSRAIYFTDKDTKKGVFLTDLWYLSPSYRLDVFRGKKLSIKSFLTYLKFKKVICLRNYRPPSV